MKVLSFDPGKKNFAWALTEDGLVRNYGFVKNFLQGLDVNLPQRVANLEDEFRQLVANAKLDHATDYICAERFMHRPGMGMGAVSEYINISLGLMMAWAKPVEMYIITSALWKNHMDKSYGSEGQKFEMLTVLDPKGKHGLTTHEADAIGIGLYCHERDSGKQFVKKCFKGFNGV